MIEEEPIGRKKTNRVSTGISRAWVLGESFEEKISILTMSIFQERVAYP